MLWLQNLLLPLILSRFQSGEWPVLITFSGVHVLSVMVGFLTQESKITHARKKKLFVFVNFSYVDFYLWLRMKHFEW